MKRVFLLLVVALSLAQQFIVLHAHAQSVDSERVPDKKRVLMVSFETDKKTIAPFIEVIAAQLSDLPIVFETVWLKKSSSAQTIESSLGDLAAPDTDIQAILWCNLKSSNSVALHMYIPRIDKFFVRALGNLEEGGMPETVGIIVRASMDAILKGAADTMYNEWEESKVEKIAPAVVENKPIQTSATKDMGDRLTVSGAYIVEMLTKEFPLIQGATFDVGFRINRKLYGFLAYAFFPDFTIKGDLASFVFNRHAFLLGGRFAGSRGPWFMGVSLGVGVDLAVEKKIEPIKGYDPWKEGVGIEVSLAPSIDFGVRLFSHFRLFLRLGADVYIEKINYGVEEKGAFTEDVSPWRIRAKGLIGLSAYF